MLGGLQTSTLKKKPLDINILLFDARVKNRSVLKSIIKVQSLWRMRAHRVKYRAIKYVVIQIKRVFIRKKRRFSRARFFTTKYLSIIQSLIRMHLIRMKYTKFRNSVLRIQACMRKKVVRRWYLACRNASILIQTMVRRVFTYYSHRILRKRMIADFRAHIFLLWNVLHVPLIYRSHFWESFNGESFLILTALKLELLNLFHRMGHDDISSIYVQGFLQKVKDISKNGSLSRVSSLPMVIEASKREKEERKHVYTCLKRVQTKSKDSIDIYFLPFDLLNSKKRKQTLASSLLWNSLETANASTDIIVHLLGHEFPQMKSGVPDFRTSMMAALMREFAVSCFKALCEEASRNAANRSEEY